LAVQGDMLYVNNRFHVAAYDLARQGQRRWQSPAPPDRGRTHDWTMTAMRPLVVGDRIIVRQLQKQRPIIMCLAADSGKPIWTLSSANNEEFASDPMLARGQLLVLTVARTPLVDDQLQLHRYSLEAGELLETVKLANLRDVWRQSRACRVSVLPDGFVATLGGAVMCCDFDGRVRWARKQLHLPPPLDPQWITQRFDRPLVQGSRVFVAGPGGPAVECIELDSGKLIWRQVMPKIDRLVAAVDGRLIVHAGDEFLGLDGDTGTVVWRTRLPEAFDAELSSDAHGLLVARPMATKDDPNAKTPQLVWLDAATGQPTHQAALAELRDRELEFGPLIAHAGRLWTFFAQRVDDPHRDLVSLEPRGEAEPFAPGEERIDTWTRLAQGELLNRAADALPGWSLLSTARYGQIEKIGEIHGERDLFVLAATPTTPAVVGRYVEIPDGGSPRLSLRIGTEPNHQWRLVVRMGDVVVDEREVIASQQPQVFQDFTIDLAPLRGRKGWLTVESHHMQQHDHARTFWKRVELQ
ncbi:MAG: PQQ-binding-like beta-propeller repeat protein, partial [Planctomycetales bacterium]|nr:PQQ-binding-like beta-propeller repeat protein [Planctomycetales bacterium]